MKHFTQATANGLCTPPCGSSHGKSTRFFFLTLLLGLLTLGSTSAWAWVVRGRGLTGLTSGSGSWEGNNNYVTMIDAGNNLYYAVFQNQAARSDNEYRYKICDGWKGTENYDSSKGNVNLVSADDKQISFTLPVASDVYIFYNSSTDKTWTIALPTRISDYDSDFYIKQDLSISSGSDGRNSNFGWASGRNALHLSHKADGGFTKYTVGVVIPSTMKWRYEMPSINSKPSVSKTTVDKSGSSNPILYFMGWDGSSSSFTCLAEIPNPTRKKGWTLYEKKSGESYHSYSVADNGSVTVEGLAPGNHYFYFANANNTIHRHGVDWFGGLYVKNSECSGVTTYSNTYYHTNKIGTVSKSIPHEDSYNYDNQWCYIDSTGYFTLADGHTYDVTFTFDGGKITINAVDHGSDPEPPTPSGVTYDGSEYIFWNTNTGNNWGVLVFDYDRTQYLQFKNTSTGALSCTVKPAFLDNKHDGDGQEGILAAIAPAGTWHQVRACRIDANNWNGQNDSGWPISDGVGNWVDLEEGKNYLYKDNGNLTWGTHSLTNFRFYLSGTTNLTGQDWGWKGNNTEYAGTAVKTLNADTYQFKLNPVGAYIYQSSGRNQWLCEANYNDFDQENSNVTCSNVDNDRIQFTLSRKHDVTIAWSGYKITVNAVPYYNVTFNSDGGSDVASQSVLSGGTASQPSDPTKAGGYTFNGWKLNDAAYSFSTAVTSDIELVADWTAPTLHTVRFMDGETELTGLAQNIVEGGHASAPNPTKEGYSSVEWRENGVNTAFDFANTAINADLTLYAFWTPKTLESISLDESSIVMVKGGSNATLTPSYLPTDLIAEKRPTYDWSVSEGGVVTVDGGVITAVGEGTVTVTCTARGTDKSATCTVNVKDCNTVPTNIFSYTLGSDPTGDAAGSAVMNGMFDEANNTEPAELTKLQIKFGDNSHITGAYVAYVVDKNTEYVNFAASNTTDNSYWYKTYQTESDANNQIFTLKNAATGNYLALSNNLADNSNGDWIRYFATTTTTINNASKWKQGTSNAYRLYNQSNTNLFLHIYNVAGDTRNDGKVVVGGEQGSQGNNQLKFTFENVNEHASNPAYMHSPDASGYYRFATSASVVATLNRAIKVNDVIRLEVKNPSEAAVSATVTIGSQVENINLAAGATSTETITVTDGSRPTSITIASNDVNFMLKSVVVNREMPNPGKDPNLAWEGTIPATWMVSEGTFQHTVSHLGTGLVTYSSSDETLATVAADGTVTPIAEGDVTITATLEQDGCYNGGSTSYSLTLEDLPKPTITITANEEMPQGSYQTVTVTQNGDGALTFGITSGTGATLTNNGEGTYLLALAGNATDIVLTASTERTGQHAQHSVSKNISVQQCYVDGHVIYEYELTGHADATDVVATGGTYSQANLASVGTTDNPATVTKIKLKFSKGNGNRIYAVDNGGNLRVQDVGNVDIAEWLLIPAGETVSNPFGTNASYPVYYVCNAKTGRYIYYGSTTSGSGDWVYTIAQLSSTNYKTNYYKWFIEVNNGETRIFSVQNRTNERKSSFKLNSANQYDSGYGSDVKNDHSLLCVGKMSDTNEYSRIYTDNGEMNVGSAANPDYFYSVENDNHTYYILNGGTVTVSRASAFKADDVITLNVFNRGAAADNTIKVANNTIATNVNGAAALQYTVAEGDGIQGQNSFVITPLNGYICLSSISIFRPKDEDEFINPTLTWDDDLSAQQRIDMNNSETGMTHTVSVNAPVNEAVVYSVSPAAKADINSATGALTLTNEAQNKDVLTVTATLPAIGCYNQAVASYEIYVKNLATPTLSAAFGTLKQGYASTLTVTTNSDAVPALSSLNGFAVNGDPTVDNGVYTYNIIVSSTAEAVSVHVALEETADYLAYAIDAADANVAVSNIADLYDNTPANGTLVLEADYAGELVINKTLTINGNGHSIGNLTVENSGDLTLSGNLTVNDFSIYAKAGNSEHQAASGQVRSADKLTVNGNAYFLYTVDPSGTVHYGWYDFTVPFPVNVMSGIAGIDGSGLNENFVNERDYAIMEFLGDKKAAGQYAYKKFRGIMQPGILYSITLDDDYNYNTIRFKKTDGALAPIASVDLPGHSGEITTKENWNGVGNGSLHHINIGGVSPEVIQVYQSGDKSFLPVNPSSCSFAVGVAFMIQGTGTMTFPQASNDLLAPRRAASAPQRTAIQIAGEGKPFSDQLFISADEMAGQAYTQGVDVAKAGDLGSAKVAQLWTNAYNTPLCAHEAQLINGEAHYALSIYAPANGSYTLTSQNIPDGATLYLTQNGNMIWDLSEAYTLDLTKGTNTEYSLLLVESHKIPTGVDAINSNADTKKIMHNGILYILRNGKVFNAQGAVMK